MSRIIQGALMARKNTLIKQLIGVGIYKKGDQQLYELTLTELEKEYEVLKEQAAKGSLH